MKNLAARWWAAIRPQTLVCLACLREDDEVVGQAGDYSCCERCSASITSKTGKAVVKNRRG